VGEVSGEGLEVLSVWKMPQRSHGPLVSSRAAQGLPREEEVHSHRNIIAFLFSIEVPIVCAMQHTDEAEELKISIRKA